jgi:hypothetical protein
MRVLVVSADAVPGHEGRNLRLASELLRRGHRVVHTGPSSAFKRVAPASTTFEPSFAETEIARRAGTRLYSSPEEFCSFIDWCEVVLFGIGKHTEPFVRYAEKEGRILLWHLDVGADHRWIPAADQVAVRGAFDIEPTMAGTALSKEIIRITGCVQFDDAAPQHQRLDRASFCRKYGLDEKRRIAALLTLAPAIHTDNVKRVVRRLAEIIAGVPGFDLIIKPHPREIARDKQATTYADATTPTWQQLTPGFPACEPRDKYDCFRHADVLVSLAPNIFREAALVRRPVLEVGKIELATDLLGADIADLAPYIRACRFRPPGRYRFRRFGILDEIVGELPQGTLKDNIRNEIEYQYQFYRGKFPDFIGSECNLEELPEVLSTGAYRFDDARAYEEYIAEYCFANDGLAHKRVADMVEAVERHPVLEAKLRRTQGIGRLRGMAKRQMRTWRRMASRRP